jgi:haloalkane dehalogenase
MNRRNFIGVALFALGSCSAAARRTSAPPGRLDATAFHRTRRFVPTKFGEIAMVERGSGDAALFLHGFPLNGYQWRGALERLAGHRRCIAPDFLGLGYTRVARGQSLAPAAQAAMIVALLDALAIDRVDLVANDSGAAIAQLVLAHHPQRVRSLLLTNGDCEIECPPAALQPVIELAREGQYVARWLAPWLADKELARSAQGLGGLTFTHPAQLADDTIEMYLRPLVEDAERTHAFTVALAANSLAGIAARLQASRVPTRILWGTGDPIFSRENPRYLDRILGNSRGVRYVPAAKLFFPEELPDLIAEEARSLWGVP